MAKNSFVAEVTFNLLTELLLNEVTAKEVY